MSFPNSPNPQPSKADQAKRRFGSASRDFLHDPLQLGTTIVGVTALFGGAGWWLDTKLGTFPILMVLGSVVGLFGSLYSLILRLKAQDREQEEKKATKP